MRGLHYFGITILIPVGVALACQPVTIIQDDDDGAASSSSDGGTTVTPAESTSGTTEQPSDDTTSTSSGTASGSGSSTGPEECQVGQACGNGCIEGTEQCDCGGEFCTVAGLDGQMCAGLVNPLFPDRVYTGGVLDCNPASCQFNFGMCTFCGDTLINGNEICELDSDPGPSCQQLGMGNDNTPLPCGPDCQWYTACCGPMPPKDCP